MDWLRLKLAEAIGGKQPISKKLLLVVGGIIATVVFLINGISSPKNVEISTEDSLQADQVAVQAAIIYVHIVGEISQPGIYQLESGARLMDAIFAAGGLTKSADQSSVNLARELTDGEQVVVFKTGEAPSTASTNGAAAGGKISLNRASQAELEQLPGVGPALAGRILDWRSANGGFKKKEDLLNISGIGDKLFAGLKNEVVL